MKKWTLWTLWTIWTLVIIVICAGCSRLTIERTYGDNHITSEIIRTSGFFMNRAQKINFNKAESGDSATDTLTTDMNEDASPGNQALKDVMGLAQTMVSMYMSGVDAGKASGIAEVVTGTCTGGDCK